MIDIRFNPKEADILLIDIDQSGNQDFWLGDDVSTGEQNGFIMLSTTCVNHTNPSLGLNNATLINAPRSEQIYFFNAWKISCTVKDRAQTAKVTFLEADSTGNPAYNLYTQYP